MAVTERDYWADPEDTDSRGIMIFGSVLFVSVALFLIGFVVWADHAVLDVVSRGQAKIIPSSQVQVIQNLEGGILSEVLVREGDVVDRDQVILRIDNTTAESNFRDLRQRYLSGLAAVARLEAEVTGRTPDEIVFPEEVQEGAPLLVEAEIASARIRRDQLRSQLAVLEDQRLQREQEINELTSQLANLGKALALASQELQIMRPLVADGVVAKIDFLQKQREVQSLESEIDATELSLPRAKTALQEAENRVQERVLTFRTDASAELSKQRLELASVTAQLTANRDRVRRTEVRSPVRGTVKEIKIRTIGGVIKPGEDLMEVVPIEDTLLVEAQVRTSDRGFIRVGQHAIVKLDTYDYSIYGGLDAEVEFISSDAIEDESSGKRERYFRVRLRTERNYLGTAEEPLRIGPGDTATVDILTDKRTVLDYLLKPILRTRDSAFRER